MNSKCQILVIAAICTALLTAASAASQFSSEDQIVTTRHQITVSGRPLKYTARAGRLPILNNETGEVHGKLFFTAYTLDAAVPAKPRPLTFLWNGGPGSSSSLVHLLGFGPRRLRPDGSVVDNQGTWLEQTDLVFVDPIGTGYSRTTKAEYGPEFYQTRGDAESVAEFIRVYRNRFEAWDAPIFLAGESYGVIRAAAVADVLERRGIRVSGVVLMGLQLPLGQLNNDQRAALSLPNYTAAAFANKRLEPALQSDLQSTLRQAEEWAQTSYVAALARKDQLDESGRQAVVAQLSRFTGLEAKAIDAKTLTIPMEAFTKQLLADRNQVVGRYDSRLVGPLDPREQLYDPTKDPSLKDIINDIGVVRYFRNELQYQSDLKYQGPFGGGYPPPTSFRGDWMSVRWNRPAAEVAATNTTRQASGNQSATAPGSAPAPTATATPTPTPSPPDQPLRRVMIANPKLRVFVACGYYDLVCTYASNNYLAGHLEAEIPRNVIARGYGGGHALYTDEKAQMDFKRDVMKFMQDTLTSSASGSDSTQK
jgi:carboxypeptidase C (cathepsin A)